MQLPLIFTLANAFQTLISSANLGVSIVWRTRTPSIELVSGPFSWFDSILQAKPTASNLS